MHAGLPSSYVIEEGIVTDGLRAHALSNTADVWKGHYNGEHVAIKSLRIYGSQSNAGEGDREVDRRIWRLKQVRLLIPPLF